MTPELLRSLARGRPGPPAARDPFSALYHGIAFYAQFLGDNYVEAIRLAREATRQRSDFLGGHRVLPRPRAQCSLAWIAREMPMKREVNREHYLRDFAAPGCTRHAAISARSGADHWL